VTDDKDKCPNTHWGVKVDLNGCPLPVADADHDGVPDSLDKCPGTRAGVKVDTNGCPEIVIVRGAKLIIDGIVFKTGSAVIDNVSAPVLARAAVAISKAPDARIEVAGFTDNVGGYAYNQKLSERRAASVKHYLVKSGVPARQLTTRGYGEEEPVVDNASAASRSDNRRIEFRVK
jgi:OOP family OmpA-OmpF porin